MIRSNLEGSIRLFLNRNALTRGFLTELKESPSKVINLKLFKLRPLNKDSGKASAQDPMSVKARRLKIIGKFRSKIKEFLPREKEQHTFPAGQYKKIHEKCQAFSIGLSRHG